MWRLLTLLLLCLFSLPLLVIAQPDLYEFPYVATLQFTNTTRTYEPILMNISQWLINNCTMPDSRDLRITETIDGTEYNKSYEFINTSLYHSVQNTTNNYALFIVNSTANTINLYCGVMNAERINTTVFEVYDSFENPGTPFWQFWRIQNGARTFAASTSYKIDGAQSITRSGQYNPNLNHTINSAVSNTLPITVSVGVYTTDETGQQTANSIVINNAIGGTEAYTDIGIGLYNTGYFVYDCSNSTDIWSDSAITVSPNTWYIMKIKVFSNWNELWVNEQLAANCTVAPVMLGALRQVRLTAGKPNDNYAGTSDDKYFDNAKVSNNTFNDYVTKNNMSYYVSNYSALIISPNTSSPVSVSSGENVTIKFLVTDDGQNVTSGVSIINASIGGIQTGVCQGTLNCSLYSNEESCNNCGQCNWGLISGNETLYSITIDDTPTAVNSLYGTRAITSCPDEPKTTLYATWKSSGADLWFGRSADNGATWNTSELTATASTYTNIVCDSNGVLTITAVLGGDVDFFNSTNKGLNWNTTADRINDVTNMVHLSSVVCSKDNIVHSVVSNTSIGIYSNSTMNNTDKIILATTSAADDWDAGDITLDNDCNVYIVGSGTDLDDIEVWSSKDWSTSYVINETPGAFVITDIPSIHATNDGRLYINGVWGLDSYFCNSTVDNWNVGWSCQKVDTANSYQGIMEVTEDGEGIYLLYANSTNASASYIMMTNSSDAGKTWSSRTVLSSGANLAKFNAITPIANITDRLHILNEIANFNVQYTYMNINHNECVAAESGSCSLCSIGDCQTTCSIAGCSIGYDDIFSYVNGYWELNLTTPNLAQGLKDLFLNVSYNGEYLNDTETECIDYSVSDSCSYSGSGDWTINCNDNCNITSNTNIAGNVTVSNASGVGALFLSSGGFFNFTKPGQFMYVDKTCQVKISPGGGIR